MLFLSPIGRRRSSTIEGQSRGRPADCAWPREELGERAAARICPLNKTDALDALPRRRVFRGAQVSLSALVRLGQSDCKHAAASSRLSDFQIQTSGLDGKWTREVC